MKVGILGAGQLARMLALAGHPLGLKFAVIDPAADACAFSVAEPMCGAWEDRELLDRMAAWADVVTCEFENVPAESLRYLAGRVPSYPPPEAQAAKRDRLREKQLFGELEVPTPAHQAVSSPEELREAVERLGLPLVLKTRSYGYDGKGQLVLTGREDVEAAAETIQAPMIAEQFVRFSREVSIVAVRGRSGQTAYYPVAENVHTQGILFISRCRPSDPLEHLARGYAARLLDRLGYVGVLAIEFFEADGRLLANEFAPRVHNTGHWTIEGAETSQFENHLRAILGWPLGATSPIGFTAMVNCIGGLPEREPLLELHGVHLHDYGKKPRAGRKLGHVTVRSGSEQELDRTLERVVELVRRQAHQLGPAEPQRQPPAEPPVEVRSL
jgi:5-(carboxyamino)imidazole ribonucleotide synthase